MVGNPGASNNTTMTLLQLALIVALLLTVALCLMFGFVRLEHLLLAFGLSVIALILITLLVAVCRGNSQKAKEEDERDGPCQRCGRTCRAVGHQFGERQLPVFSVDTANRLAFWCGRCQKVMCGQCLGARPGPMGFVKCPICGQSSEVRLASIAHWLSGSY